MTIPLDQVNKRIDINHYSFKEYSDYFLKFDNKLLCVKKKDGDKIIVKFSKQQLPHLIGLQYAYDKKTNSKSFKGIRGFELLNNSTPLITPILFKNRINANRIRVNNKIIDWNIDILPRIEWLPAFLNSIDKNAKLKNNNRNKEHPLINTLIRGDYFYYKCSQKDYLIMSLLRTGHSYTPETFVVNNGVRLLGALDDIEFINIYWIKQKVHS